MQVATINSSCPIVILETQLFYIISYLLTNGDYDLKPFKNINEPFTIEEFEEIESIKNKTGMNWHDFLLHAAYFLNASSKNNTGD